MLKDEVQSKILDHLCEVRSSILSEEVTRDRNQNFHAISNYILILLAPGNSEVPLFRLRNRDQIAASCSDHARVLHSQYVFASMVKSVAGPPVVLCYLSARKEREVHLGAR